MFDISLIVGLPALLLAISGHEYAHALVADSLGDPTPRRMGRLTLNPLAHLDPVGILCLWLLRFGWARPVQVNPYFFRGNRSTGLLLVALAGPAANLVMAWLGVAATKALGLSLGMGALLLRTFVVYNVGLAVFNLIPVPPLDGWRVLERFARGEWVETAERYGWVLLLVLLASGAIGHLMGPLVGVVYRLLDTLTFFLG
ncbi:MAG: site-2 protease family protein [Firmicutes bacterium]|nr:site-2 protease family protein [Bacillota bacterium]